MIEIKKTSVGYVPDPTDGDMRISQPVWNRYVAAKAKLAAAISAMETGAVRPLYVSPDQEEAIRAAVKPGTWIIVREPEPSARVLRRRLSWRRQSTQAQSHRRRRRSCRPSRASTPWSMRGPRRSAAHGSPVRLHRRTLGLRRRTAPESTASASAESASPT